MEEKHIVINEPARIFLSALALTITHLSESCGGMELRDNFVDVLGIHQRNLAKQSSLPESEKKQIPLIYEELVQMVQECVEVLG